MTENDHLIQTRLSKDTFKVIKKLAKESGCSVATFVRQLLIKEAKASEQAAR
jgi:hypothetical protein